jgi:ketosteroid isomerase-like protein
MQGRAAFEQGLRNLLTTHRIGSTGDVQEVVVSGDLAHSWTNLRVQITPVAGGDGVTREGSALSILRKREDGAWVVVRDANLL